MAFTADYWRKGDGTTSYQLATDRVKSWYPTVTAAPLPVLEGLVANQSGGNPAYEKKVDNKATQYGLGGLTPENQIPRGRDKKDNPVYWFKWLNDWITDDSAKQDALSIEPAERDQLLTPADNLPLSAFSLAIAYRDNQNEFNNVGNALGDPPTQTTWLDAAAQAAGGCPGGHCNDDNCLGGNSNNGICWTKTTGEFKQAVTEYIATNFGDNAVADATAENDGKQSIGEAAQQGVSAAVTDALNAVWDQIGAYAPRVGIVILGIVLIVVAVRRLVS